MSKMPSSHARLQAAATLLTVAARRSGGAVVLVLTVSAAALAQQRHYPDGMTAAERRRYYDAYNASRTPAEWDSLRRASASARAAAVAHPAAADSVTAGDGRAGSPATASVVSFRLRNRGVWPRRVEVAGNVLAFGPFETRHVQFPPDTRIHAYDARRPDGRGRLLRTVTRADEGRAFGVRR